LGLATRIIPVILARGQQAVKGECFNSWRSVGQLRQAIRVYEMRQVDEICLLDIAATPANRGPDCAFVRDFAGEFFCPVTVGGGVSTTDHFKALLANGADKIAINTAAIENPDLITQAAHRFGSQAVVVSIDVREGQVFTHCGQKPTGLDVVAWAQAAEKRGAGEILLTDILAEGRLVGYELVVVRAVSAAVNIPVVACGGAGTYQHFVDALEAGAHAVAAGAIWSFTDSTPAEAAEYLSERGIPVRKRIAA
jgi:imidazole glycerol-phosphate synthase subunit HisF